MAESLSAVIVTKNEAIRLSKCLESLSFVDEIVIVDSGSIDETQSIARAYGCRVIEQNWLGFGPQKRFAIEKAKNNWVLCLDADEWISSELASTIELLFQSNLKYKAYQMPRRNYFMGKWLRHGEGYPDWSLRLFDRRFAQWNDEKVHEQVETKEKVGSLKGDIFHESQDSIYSYLEKQNQYTSLQAERLYKLGKKAFLFKLLFNPLYRFFRIYFVRLGFLDGIPGLIHILIGCFNSFCKYVKLRELYNKGKER